MNHLEEKAEHFAKTVICKKYPKIQKTPQIHKNKQTKKPAGSTKCM